MTLTTRHGLPVPARLVIERFVVVAWPVIVVDAKETRPPDWVSVDAKVAVPVTFSLPPTFNALDWVRVVPLRLNVEVPERALAVPQNGNWFVVTTLEVVTVPEPPVLQVDVAMRPVAEILRQGLPAEPSAERTTELANVDVAVNVCAAVQLVVDAAVT